MLPVRKSLASSEKKNNINGSGVGLGHPVGAIGARLIVSLLHALKKNNKRLGLATLCGGGGVSLACAIEIIE
jgi:acetyl-CoA C-acetyltransferase